MSSSNPLADAKKVLAGANRAFPSSAAPKTAEKPAAAAPEKKSPTITDELKSKQDNVMQYANAPKMHEGGVVPGKKGADVPIIAQAGETIIPAGRKSEYRAVFEKRHAAKQQTRQDGGNTPVKGEAHEQKKA